MAAAAYTISSLSSTYYGRNRNSNTSTRAAEMLLHISSPQSSKYTPTNSSSFLSSSRPLTLFCRRAIPHHDSHLHQQDTLDRALQLAIQQEDYVLAAKIRDDLRILQQDTKTSVLAANARFYNSFKHGDLAAMQNLWSQGEHVCCVHPGVNGISGYDLVITSWEYVLANYQFPLEIKVEDIVLHVKGDLGYVTCTEFIKTKGSSWGKQSVTNVFEKIGDQWFICIHHASNTNFEK